MQRLLLPVLLVLCSISLASSPLNAVAPGPGLPAPSHKIHVYDRSIAERLTVQGAHPVGDYGAFTVFDVDETLLRSVEADPHVEVRDDENVVMLNAGPINTTLRASVAPETQVIAPTERRMHLIQFAGPIKVEWMRDLEATGVEVVAYIPSNAYLVYGDAASLANLQAFAASAFVQWEGPYQDSYRLTPSIRNRMPDTVTIQMVRDTAANPATLALLGQSKQTPILRQSEILNYVNVTATVLSGTLKALSARPDVVSIHAYTKPRKLDERQDQIMAGNLTGDGPSGPGYLAWLASKGFTQAQFTASGFAVDLTDSGVDNGTNLPNHANLYTSGARPGTSRITYNRLEGTANVGSTLEGCDGHGNINSHIIGGYNATAGFPHADAAGYHYGLGVAPFVKVGSSVIFDPDEFTGPDYGNLQSRAYRDGARISSNSWGASTYGDYDTDAQTYDALVRDAQPSTAAVPVAGNQEMVIVFAASNDGPTVGSIGSPGTGKNVITVGASENVNPFGSADGCGEGDEESDHASDIAAFSSRGPCMDGRMKPDIIAPGVHITGGVYQVPTAGANGQAADCFTASGVCGGPDVFWPAGQQLYTASSGTSHSTPALAGAAALVRQWFINHASPAPSPAMTKAYLANAARYMTGVGANDTLPSRNQGMGLVDLGRTFDATPRIVHDELPADKFTATGQTRTITGKVSDAAKPFRVTLAWTDAPGATSGAAYNNDLDLTVVIGGVTYKGNVFKKSFSVSGGSSDTRNNLESVFLPAGITGPFAVTVTAKNITSDGVPNVAPALDQDYALVIYNGTEASTPVLSIAGTSVTAESCSPANGAVDANENVSIQVTLKNLGSAATKSLVATPVATSEMTPTSSAQTFGAIAAGGAVATKSFQFLSNGVCGGTVTAKFSLADGATAIGDITMTLPVGTVGGNVPFSASAGGLTPFPSGSVIERTISVPYGGVISDVKARLRLDHPWDSDLNITLTLPDGTEVALARNAGWMGEGFGSGPNDCTGVPTVFDDLAPISVADAAAPYTVPVRSTEPLSTFNGTPAQGVWTLRIENNGPDDGVLGCFGLDIHTNLYQCCGVPGTPFVALDSYALTAEDSTTPNGAADPGETVTLGITLKSVGTAAVNNLVATVVPGGGITPVTAQQTYGAMPSGATGLASFRVTVGGACGGTATLTLHLQDGATDLGNTTMTLPIGSTGVPMAHTYASTAGPALIPDFGVLEQAINVPDIGSVSDVNVSVRLNHTWDADLRLTLISPDGTAVKLVEGAGDDGDNFGTGANDCTGVATVFDDSAGQSIMAAAAPFSGSFKPVQALSTFNGKSAHGAWRLRIYDLNPQDSGSIGCWKVTVTTRPYDCGGIAPPGTVVMGAATLATEGCTPNNGVPDTGEVVSANFSLKNVGYVDATAVTAELLPTGGVTPVTAPQSYGTVVKGATVTRTFYFRTDAACGSTITPTFRLAAGPGDLGTVSAAFPVGITTVTPASYSPTLLPLPIPDSGSITSPVTVSRQAFVNKIKVRVRLNHTWDGDIRLTLIGPDGTSVVISDRNGYIGENYGSGTNNCAGTPTIFDDAAATSIVDGTAPFAGSYRPEFPLSQFKGRPTQGVWTLKVEDTADGDTGTLGCWTLDLADETYACCAGASLTTLDVQRALRIASGIGSATSDDKTRLNVVTSGESTNVIDAADVLRIARKVAGLDP